MNLIDGVLLTLVNAIACLAFPKLLSVILAAKNKDSAPVPITIPTQKV
ncbi:hypothetical protein [Iningainema tapete]|uniref:Uncharacterized protein n=1 Tax=Iningainema tapete BLCC-T55 TaxID=2748662 RepID=A0A8J7BXQ5_9CYAN|nr:hypothetical protein [Iningainema tapete]MBD2774182.1 hypothetical protein [Iningainema tapete BLCC-T55]